MNGTEVLGGHPFIDGRPVLIGDLLHATDPECRDREGNTFTMEGRVTSIIIDYYPGPAIILTPLEAGMTEEFYFNDTIFHRIEAPS